MCAYYGIVLIMSGHSIFGAELKNKKLRNFIARNFLGFFTPYESYESSQNSEILKTWNTLFSS